MAQRRFNQIEPPLPTVHAPANKYDPRFCDEIKMLAQAGHFPEEWLAHLGVVRSTLYAWADNHPEFEDAMHAAFTLLQAYWARTARENLQGVGIPPSTLARILERRFPAVWGLASVDQYAHFRDRNKMPDPDHPDAEPDADVRKMTNEELQQRIAQLEARRDAQKQ